jgi:hypothetical protein
VIIAISYYQYSLLVGWRIRPRPKVIDDSHCNKMDRSLYYKTMWDFLELDRYFFDIYLRILTGNTISTSRSLLYTQICLFMLKKIIKNAPIHIVRILQRNTVTPFLLSLVEEKKWNEIKKRWGSFGGPLMDEAVRGVWHRDAAVGLQNPS